MQTSLDFKIDAKSLITGFVAGAGIFLCIAATDKGPASAGRFQTILNDNGTIVMTDTVTGQAWHSDFPNPSTLRDQEFKKPKLQ